MIPTVKAKCRTEKLQIQLILFKCKNKSAYFLNPGVAFDNYYSFLPMISLQTFLIKELFWGLKTCEQSPCSVASSNTHSLLLNGKRWS